MAKKEKDNVVWDDEPVDPTEDGYTDDSTEVFEYETVEEFEEEEIELEDVNKEVEEEEIEEGFYVHEDQEAPSEDAKRFYEEASQEGEIPAEGEETKQHAWGYGWIIIIFATFFGSITVSVHLMLIRTSFSIPNLMVTISVISLLIFLLMVILRYFVLIYMSYLQHNQNQSLDNVESLDYRVSILVPAYNEGVLIEKSILSMIDMDYHNYEVIVINDGSTDETFEVAKSLEGWHGNVLVRVLTQENMGKSAALNHGANEASGDIILCVDGDSKLSRGTLKAAIRHFTDPRIAAVAGNVKVVNRFNTLTRLQALEYVEGLNMVRRAQAFIKAVNIIPGPCGFFRRDALVEVGGWDNDTYAEDCDLTLKLLTRGYRIDYEPMSISYTEAPEKLIQLLKQRYRWTRGILQAMRKHRSHLIDPTAGWRTIVTMWQMVFEGIFWPFMNILANMMFLLVAILFGMSPLIVLWWVQLTILDTIAAMHAVAIERERLMLIPYAILYRLYFVTIVDMAKLIATFEELMGLQMSWGKVKRVGRL
ncbi:glycosyltransferase family 2 protein [bacterium]|nr:glycosyltransferase family 2 protein [bacterium]